MTEKAQATSDPITKLMHAINGTPEEVLDELRTRNSGNGLNDPKTRTKEAVHIAMEQNS